MPLSRRLGVVCVLFMTVSLAHTHTATIRIHRTLWQFLHPDDVNPFHAALGAAILQVPGQRIVSRLRSLQHPMGYLTVDVAVRYGQQGVVLFMRPEQAALVGLVGGAGPLSPIMAPPPPSPLPHQQPQQQQQQQQQRQQHHGAGGSLNYGTMASAFSAAGPFMQGMGMTPPPQYAAVPPPPSPLPSPTPAASLGAMQQQPRPPQQP